MDDVLLSCDPRPLLGVTLKERPPTPFPCAEVGRWVTAARPGQAALIMISVAGTGTTRLGG